MNIITGFNKENEKEEIEDLISNEVIKDIKKIKIYEAPGHTLQYPRRSAT